MAKYYTTLPVERWYQYRNYLTHVHDYLVHTQDVLHWPYLAQELRKSGRSIILDNGVIEYGKAAVAAQICDAIDFVNPNIVITPDIIGGTLEQNIELWDNFNHYVSSAVHNEGLPNNWELMAVYHGECTPKDIRKFLQYWGENRERIIIGIPKHYKDRLELVQELVATYHHNIALVNVIGYHLLGFYIPKVDQHIVRHRLWDRVKLHPDLDVTIDSSQPVYASMNRVLWYGQVIEGQHRMWPSEDVVHQVDAKIGRLLKGNLKSVGRYFGRQQEG